MAIIGEGQVVALMCPGAVVTRETAEAAKKWLWDNYKLSAVYNRETYEKISAAQRAEIFLSYLFDKNVAAIWALRGGEGSADVIPFLQLQADKIAKVAPKMLIGFSDITALLIYFAQVFKWPVLHAAGIPQFLTNVVDVSAERSLMDFLLGRTKQLQITDLEPLNTSAKKTATITAEVCGGNLSLINISVKEVWELQGKNKLLIIEDVREKPHVVDRTLKHLQRIGIFAETAAIIFGDFTSEPIGSDVNEQAKNKAALDKVLTVFAESCSFPVLKTSRLGHGYFNDPVLFAKPAQLYLGETNKLVMKIN